MIFDYAEDPGRALDAAVRTLERGGLVVLPTDTVYGIGVDAFSPEAVQRLLSAKGRGRQMPPPVLVSGLAVLDALAAEIRPEVRALVERFWPGALTVILRAQPSLKWDLGETDGTVALRMPDHPIALALVERWGPMAVTSANISGRPAAQEAATAEGYFGAAVAVYLDGGPTPGLVPSTIVDATSVPMRIVRPGVLAAEVLAEVAPELVAEGAVTSSPENGTESGTDSGA
ncbi:MAG TPA: L-threonylcarbamoyladenylate synthase [Actinomycetaceae bacterium]|nr:L-threonylcarbamoyladenylate synthase [Actinomycetaceae bacterium]